MIEPSCRVRAGGVFSRLFYRASVVCAVSVPVFLTGGKADAQLTTQILIGDSVSEVGNKYTDVDEAIKRFMNRDVLAARQFLESAKKKDPSLPPVELLLAKMFFIAQNAQAGRISLEKTVVDNPDDPEPYLILADQAMQQGRTIDAEALYDKGLAIAEKFSGNNKRKRNFEIRGRSGRALVDARRKKWDDAITDLKALLQLDPENGSVHYRLGQALFMKQQFQEGFNELTTAKQKDKDLPDPMVAAAAMYDQLKQADKAQQAFDRAIGANKTDPVTVTSYAQWLIRSGKPENLTKAEALLAEARKANPGNLNLLILSGVNAHMLKKMKPAEDYLVEAIGIAPANADVINELALVLIEQADQTKKNRAAQFAAMNAQINNQSADAQITLAWVMYQLGRNAEAEQALRNAQQMGNASPDSTYLVAKMMAEQNRADAAKQLLNSAFENDTSGIFIFRKEAQALRDSLAK